MLVGGSGYVQGIIFCIVYNSVALQGYITLVQEMVKVENQTCVVGVDIFWPQSKALSAREGGQLPRSSAGTQSLTLACNETATSNGRAPVFLRLSFSCTGALVLAFEIFTAAGSKGLTTASTGGSTQLSCSNKSWQLIVHLARRDSAQKTSRTCTFLA